MGRLTRIKEVLLCLLLVYKVNTVTCQLKGHGYIGDTILLPCTISNVDDIRKSDPVYWMDKDDKVVLEITKSGPKPSGQDKKYKDQIISFPELYKTGNFSILMKNVQESDSGPYDCVINSVNFEQRVYLNVSGERVRATETYSGSSGVAAVTPNSLRIILLSLPLSLLFSCSKICR